MKAPQWLRILILHAALLALVAVPIALVVFHVIQVARGESDGTGLLDLTVVYPGIALFSMIGGVLYTAALELVARNRPISSRLAVVLTPLVLLPWLVFSIRSLLLFPPFAAGVAVGLFAFGVLSARLRSFATSVRAAA